ncbi:MAG: lipoate--protein ligase [Candidatus Helarchaeota archaeon]
MTQKWRLLNIGLIDPIDSQIVYEAVAIARNKDLISDTIIFCSPRSPVVCVGYHQELEKEVNLEYCKKNNIPIVRRILGGGAVYLDSNQLFYQIIVSEKNKEISRSIEKLFSILLKAPIKTYNDIGIPATFKPINDIEVRGKKISGNGAGKLEDVSILTGNLILDFNFDEMVKILKVPSEKFRDKIAKSLKERITTIKKEVSKVPPREELKNLLKKNFEEILNIKLIPEEMTSTEKQYMKELREKYTSREWLYGPELRHPGLLDNLKKYTNVERTVKISGGVYVGEAVYKSSGGLIRVTLEIENDIIRDVLLSGDFWLFPTTKISELEKVLKGVKIEKDRLNEVLNQFFEKNKIQSLGTTVDDFVKTILMVRENA